MRIAAVVMGGALLACSVPSAAAQWVPVSESATDTWHIDLMSMRQDGNIRSAWLKVDHSRDPKIKARESRWLKRFNCSAWTSRTASITYYRPDGTSINTDTYPEFGNYGFEPLVPDTVMDDIARFVCSGPETLKRQGE